MIRLLKNNQFASLLISLGMVIAFGIVSYSVESEHQSIPIEVPFARWMQEGLDALFGLNGSGSIVVVISLISIQSLVFGILAERTQLLYKTTWLPVLFFGLLNLTFPEQFYTQQDLWSNMFLLLAVMAMFRAQGMERALPALMNAGLLSGLAFMFSPSTFLFIPLFLIGIVLFKQVRGVDIFQYLFGYAFVLLTTLTVLKLIGRDEIIDQYLQVKFLHLGQTSVWKDPYFSVFVAGLALIMVPTFLRLQQNFYKNTIRVRKLQQFILIYFFVAIVYAIFGAQKVQTAFGILALPLAVYLTYYFLPDKRIWLKESIFLLLLFAIFMQHARWF
ncbi:MAG: DUF6427 family protein [Bacteroidota bacterium]|nr:DUF6427 family protein [Bacteroidota bacterium]MDX5429765.1 DUF6427 family protein [Bacteroidota bacterium]MDX5468544.1 DUF6427 family protein [Bacteroidota bacterium]